MASNERMETLRRNVGESEHPYELAVDVMYALQKHYGYLSDEALCEGARILGMSPLELEEIATFYDFIYREPVGKYVIHVCDGVVCWMCHEGWTCEGERGTVIDYLCKSLGVGLGETTPDGLFTVLPSCCIGYCDHAPAMLVNGMPYGFLTPDGIDQILQKLRTQNGPMAIDR
jgi:NADH-quinone oxidoreductase subunit E